MTENLYRLHDEDVLDRLYLEDGQVADLVVDFRGVKSESLGELGNLAHSLLPEDRHTAIPHLKSQLLQQVLEVPQNHLLVNLEVHDRINVVLPLHHEKLDFAPHIDRFHVKHKMVILFQVILDLDTVVKWNELAILVPELLDGLF